MGFLKRLFGKSEKVVVLALDGVPHSMCKSLYRKGEFKYLGGKDFERMTSVYPTISSVAWATFMTGKNPGKHGIYGFLDRIPGNSNLTTPDGSFLKEPTLWRHLSDIGKRCFVMNVPMTYPPSEINGKLVSGFLCGDIRKGTYPPEFADTLAGMGYQIDADSTLALETMQRFLEDLHVTFDARERALFKFIDERWDFFMVQFMGTDRINHFLMGDWVEGGDHAQEFIDYYRKVDSMVGRVMEHVGDDGKLLIMSDHGFAPLKKEVQLNTWLKETGYLGDVNGYSGLGKEDKAFTLIPGRIYINLEDREFNGGVSVSKYDEVLDDISREIKGLVDPDTGEKVIQKVFRRDEIYYGDIAEDAADLIVHPTRGYDLKGSFKNTEIFEKGPRSGVHTYKDAFVYSNAGVKFRNPNILDIFPTILDLLEVDKPDGLDGKSMV